MAITNYPSLEVKISGDLACFTRPEMKAERVSYPVITPSAARGVLEAIFWKPEFLWRIDEIHVLRPIRYFSILRNEGNSQAIYRTATGWKKTGYGGYSPAIDRSQRHTLALRDVSYIVRAQIILAPHADDVAKYRDQFRRRVKQGRCFATPYLGCREFSAAFEQPAGDEQPIPLTDDLGMMLMDMQYEPSGSGRGTPIFFKANLQDGVLHVPNRLEVA